MLSSLFKVETYSCKVRTVQTFHYSTNCYSNVHMKHVAPNKRAVFLRTLHFRIAAILESTSFFQNKPFEPSLFYFSVVNQSQCRVMHPRVEGFAAVGCYDTMSIHNHNHHPMQCTPVLQPPVAPRRHQTRRYAMHSTACLYQTRYPYSIRGVSWLWFRFRLSAPLLYVPSPSSARMYYIHIWNRNTAAAIWMQKYVKRATVFIIQSSCPRLQWRRRCDSAPTVTKFLIITGVRLLLYKDANKMACTAHIGAGSRKYYPGFDSVRRVLLATLVLTMSKTTTP